MKCQDPWMHGFKDVGCIKSVTESRKIRQAESNILPHFFELMVIILDTSR